MFPLGRELFSPLVTSRERSIPVNNICKIVAPFLIIDYEYIRQLLVYAACGHQKGVTFTSLSNFHVH